MVSAFKQTFGLHTLTHPGVIWDNLTVRGIGGTKNFVKVFPNAFIDFFNVPGTIMSILGYGKKGKEFNILHDFRGVAKPGRWSLCWAGRVVDVHRS